MRRKVDLVRIGVVVDDGVLVRNGGEEGKEGVVDVDGEAADGEDVHAQVELDPGRVGKLGVKEEGFGDVLLHEEGSAGTSGVVSVWHVTLAAVALLAAALCSPG